MMSVTAITDIVYFWLVYNWALQKFIRKRAPLKKYKHCTVLSGGH